MRASPRGSIGVQDFCYGRREAQRDELFSEALRIQVVPILAAQRHRECPLDGGAVVRYEDPLPHVNGFS